MDSEIAETIKNYKKNLESAGVKVKKIILFGSYASGNPRPGSDLDLVVISNDFKNMSLLEKLGLLSRARSKGARLTGPMEILGYTEDEFAAHDPGSFIEEEIKAKGIQVA